MVRGEGKGGDMYICFPPKMSRCWTGGMPSFSSTRSFIRDTWGFWGGEGPGWVSFWFVD